MVALLAYMKDLRLVELLAELMVGQLVSARAVTKDDLLVV